MAYKDPNDPRALESRRKHYHNNKEAYLLRAAEQKRKMKQLVADIKRNAKCSECGISYPGEPWLMEFDHRDPTEKVDSIGAIITKYSMKKLLAELDKCNLLCVVCHRRKTARDAGWSELSPEATT